MEAANGQPEVLTLERIEVRQDGELFAIVYSTPVSKRVRLVSMGVVKSMVSAEAAADLLVWITTKAWRRPGVKLCTRLDTRTYHSALVEEFNLLRAGSFDAFPSMTDDDFQRAMMDDEIASD